MNNIRYDKILEYLYRYYDTNNEEFIKYMKKKENKYMFLLLLKRNNSLNIEKVCNKIGEKNIKNIKKNIKVAEMKLLVNKDFREKYFEIECEIRKNFKI